MPFMSIVRPQGHPMQISLARGAKLSPSGRYLVVAYFPCGRSDRHFCAYRPPPAVLPSAFAWRPRPPEEVSIAAVAD